MVIVETKSGYIFETKKVSGPSSYATGGFSVDFPKLSQVHDAVVSLEDGDNLYKAGYSLSSNVVTITVYQLGFDTTTSTVTVSEVAAGTDLSSLNFKIVVVGE